MICTAQYVHMTTVGCESCARPRMLQVGGNDQTQNHVTVPTVCGFHAHGHIYVYTHI